ncbi:radical SAM superfamily enzyme,PDZ domain-containing protein [Halobacteroides halobius DSM 5150]|uniref:Radical SAM superfamily enzyme,PDZ domain-containing protein n=1 Tax=Halobacteroides halobius (strain ATCC 35273 / DSM 5150 / MD-1) TaxID=748449 RepID=L0K713_HALHC|nr:DUF512 domain-containing protein [Halobacteroides halobius]AGB40310.1 radical SAM superfamily enzyme,PDZ domain-containing protein [Halobacteroides halobius DSM 5150]
MITIEYSEQQLAILSAQKYNILPVTSACNVNCLFCSHQGNPAEVETFSKGHRPLVEVKELISMLDHRQKIVIGESITRICEGEPTTHPQFSQIMKLLRDRFPDTPIKLTTNGTRLTEENIDLLSKLNPIEINLSLNSATLEGRDKLMNDRQGAMVLKAMQKLEQLNIKYHGSIVAMPHQVGWDDLEETISYLNQTGAKTIRVFLPGYTKYSPEYMKFELSLWQDLQEFIEECKSNYQVPITLEPTEITNLNALVEGAILNSPADKAGIKRGDRILKVNNQPVFSRVDAFYKLTKAEEPMVILERSGEEIEIRVKKEKGEKPGIVVSYDLAPDLIERIKKIIRSYRADKVLILTSQLAEARLKLASDSLKPDNTTEIKILAVENQFFAGSILSAGLLTVDDFKQRLRGYQGALAIYDLVLLPQIAFDFAGYDLVGERYHQLEDEFEIEMELV